MPKQKSNTNMLAALILSHLWQLVSANYCEFGLCNDENQYCCGKNKCCSKSSNLWFFWAGILVIVFVLVVVAICNRKPQQDPQYSKLPMDERIAQTT